MKLTPSSAEVETYMPPWCGQENLNIRDGQEAKQSNSLEVNTSWSSREIPLIYTNVLCPHQPATCSYPEPHEPTPRHPVLFNYPAMYSGYWRLFRLLPPKSRMHLSFSLYVPHGLPVPSSLIRSRESSLVRNHKASRCAAFIIQYL